MGSNNSRTGKIDVNPVVADGEKRPIDGKSADDASIRYAQDSSDAIDLSTLKVKSVSLTVVPRTAPADGTTAVQGAATVTMSDGSLAKDGTTVTFAATNGATADPKAPATSGGQGQAKTNIASKTVGTSNVTATAGSVTSAPVSVQFTEVPRPTDIYLQALDKTYASVGGPGQRMGDGNIIVSEKTSPDDSCKFFIESNSDGTVSFRAHDGRYVVIETDDVGATPNALIASSSLEPGDHFHIEYQDGGSSMTIQWKGQYVSLVASVDNFLAAIKDQPDPYCYFTVTSWTS